MNKDLKEKLVKLDRTLRCSDVRDSLERLKIRQPEQIQQISTISTELKGTELEGIPFEIAIRKAKLMSDKEIADDLDMPLRAVRKFSQVKGFGTLLNQLSTTLWSEITLAAQARLLATIQYGEQRDAIDTSKWILERTGQVMSAAPGALHKHETIVMNGLPGQETKALPGGTIQTTPEAIAEALMQRIHSNQKSRDVENSEPPKRISE